MENKTTKQRKITGFGVTWFVIGCITFTNLAALSHQHDKLKDRREWITGIQEYLCQKTRDRFTKRNHDEFVESLRDANPDLVIPQVIYSKVDIDIDAQLPELPRGMR